MKQILNDNLQNPDKIKEILFDTIIELMIFNGYITKYIAEDTPNDELKEMKLDYDFSIDSLSKMSLLTDVEISLVLHVTFSDEVMRSVNTIQNIIDEYYKLIVQVKA